MAQNKCIKWDRIHSYGVLALLPFNLWSTVTFSCSTGTSHTLLVLCQCSTRSKCLSFCWMMSCYHILTQPLKLGQTFFLVSLLQGDDDRLNQFLSGSTFHKFQTSLSVWHALHRRTEISINKFLSMQAKIKIMKNKAVCLCSYTEYVYLEGWCQEQEEEKTCFFFRIQ